MRHLAELAADIRRIPFVHRGTHALPAGLSHAVMLLGNFDGLHRGHAQLFAAGRHLARRRGAPLAVLQCDPHPRIYFSGPSRFRVATGLAQMQLLDEAGIDLVFTPRFDETFAGLEPRHFVERIMIEQLGVGAMVAGRDFRFGRQRVGDVKLLGALSTRFGFELQVVDDEIAEGGRISTSAVRSAIRSGDLALANALLGHAWLTEIFPAAASGWRFPSDQVLPPPGQWPVGAVDRRGRLLGHAVVEVDADGGVIAALPADTALLKWQSAAIGLTSPHQFGIRGVHA